MSDYNWDTTPQQKADAIFQRGYRKGVEDMRDVALAAYYDVDCDKDPDIVMREKADELLKNRQ